MKKNTDNNSISNNSKTTVVGNNFSPKTASNIAYNSISNNSKTTVNGDNFSSKTAYNNTAHNSTPTETKNMRNSKVRKNNFNKPFSLKPLFSLLLAFIFLFSLSACKPHEKSENTVRLPGGDYGLPNPFRHSSRGPGSAKSRLVFGTLLEFGDENLECFLAESYEKDGKDVTFTLHDTKFHDGEKLTTADISFTIDYYKLHTPVINTLGTKTNFLVENVEILSEKKIKITLANDSVVALESLAKMQILPKHIWEKVTDPTSYDGYGTTVGSGAFQLTAYDPLLGAYEFSAFKDFPLTQKVDKIQFLPVSDEILAFERGDIDIASLPFDLVDNYSNNENYGIMEKTNDFGYKLLINFEKLPIFLDKELRSGLYAAIDRQNIVDKVLRYGEVGSSGYAPSGSIFFNDSLPTHPFDREKAKEIFAFSEISFKILTSSSQKDLKIAQLIKSDLEEVGITASVTSSDSVTRDSLVSSGNYEMAVVGNGGWGGKAPSYLRTVFATDAKNSGGNPHTMGPIGLDSEKITALANAQQVESDFDTRVEIFKELQLEIAKEIPLIVLATETSLSVFSTSFSGWTKTYDYQVVEQNVTSFVHLR